MGCGGVSKDVFVPVVGAVVGDFIVDGGFISGDEIAVGAMIG